MCTFIDLIKPMCTFIDLIKSICINAHKNVHFIDPIKCLFDIFTVSIPSKVLCCTLLQHFDN